MVETVMKRNLGEKWPHSLAKLGISNSMDARELVGLCHAILEGMTIAEGACSFCDDSTDNGGPMSDIPMDAHEPTCAYKRLREWVEARSLTKAVKSPRRPASPLRDSH